MRNKRASTPLPAEEDGILHRDAIGSRMVFSGVCLGLCMIAVLVEVFLLQTIHSEDLKAEATYQYGVEVALDSWRGDILDRDGALLAATVHRWFLKADPSRVSERVAPRTAAVLGELLQRDPQALLEKLNAHRSRDSHAGMNDPASRLVRGYVLPLSDRIARLFGNQRKNSTDFDSYMHRKLRFLEYFYRMDQLRARSIYELVDTLADIADKAVRTFDAHTDTLKFMQHRQRKFVKLADNLDDRTRELVLVAKKRSRKAARACRREPQQDDHRTERCADPLATIRLERVPKRYYPKRQLGTQFIGLVGSDGQGTEGIERAANGLLSGGQYSTRAIRDTRGRQLLLEGIPEEIPLGAPSVELTMDQEIQAVAEQTLSRTCQAAGARAGYAVVMEVATGEVLAAATFPTYNPNTHQVFLRGRLPLEDEERAHEQRLKDLAWAEQWDLNRKAFPEDPGSVLLETRRALTREQTAYLEHAHAFPSAKRHGAFQYAYEPGSIMKIFTLAAWLEAGVRPREHQYPLKDGAWELGPPDDFVISDAHKLKGVRSADVGLALKVSSNIVFGQMGLDLEAHAANGGTGLRQMLERFGFGRISGSGFPGETSGKVGPAGEWQKVETITISYGQGIVATGIQLASALSALANDGRLMRPLLVRRVLGLDGEVLHSWSPTEVRQVVSPQTARTVLEMMRGVVLPGGTGKRAEIPEFPVAGKTGTGQKVHIVQDTRHRHYSDDMWVATFFGVAPLSDPRLAVVVLVDEPQGRSHGGGLFAAPAFKEIMESSLRLMGVPPPMERGRQVAWLEPETLKQRRSQSIRVPAAASSVAPPVDPLSPGDVPVPDFAGLTMDQVRRLGMRSGLRIRLRGTGIATEQSVIAHARVASWSTISVDFEPRNAQAVIDSIPRHSPERGDLPSLPGVHDASSSPQTRGKVL